MIQSISPIHRFAAVLGALLLSLCLILPTQAMQADPSTPQASGEATPEADAGPVFVIRPAEGEDGDYFTLKADAGTTNELTVVLGNADDEPLNLLTYVNDAVPMTNGGLAIAEPEVPPTGPATWIDYATETYDFEPETGIERTFTVTIPEGTAPGQYIAGISLQTAEPLEVEGTSFFNQIIRKTVAVFIIVPGPETPSFELGAPEIVPGTRRDQLMIPVINSGNVLVKPRGELVLRDGEGKTVLTAPISMGSVYAGTTAPMAVGIPPSVAAGDYALEVKVTDEATSTSTQISDETVAITDVDEAPAQFAMTGSVTLAPDAKSPAFADVAAEITNAGDAVDGAEVVLEVSKDGKIVETYPIVPTLSLPQGTSTNVSQRYVPVTGWEPGLWSFVLRVNIVDPSTGAASTVATVDTIPAVLVGK